MAEAEDVLFGGDVGAGVARKSLVVVVGKTRAPLTKAQIAFNRLVKKIEKLQGELREEAARLGETLAYAEKHITPRKEKVMARRREWVIALASYLEAGKLKKAERAVLTDVLASQLAQISEDEGGLPEEFKGLFEQVHGIDFEDAVREEMEVKREQMKEMFEAFGMDIDLSGLEGDLSQEEMDAEMARIAARMKAEGERLDEAGKPRGGGKKKESKKEAQEREAEEVRKNSLSKIYRDLARLVHPDLEQDEAVKPRKAALMAKLTEAYRANDLHTLLRLELEWMVKEEVDVQRLTEEKLRVYNKVLEEQARELHGDLQELPMRPEYRNIVKQVGMYEYRVMEDGRQEAGRLDVVVKAIEQSLMRLRKGDALGEVREILREYRMSRR